MEQNAIPQNGEKPRHEPIAHLLRYGDQQKIAAEMKCSKITVNAVVNGNRYNSEIYAKALEYAQRQKQRLHDSRKLNKKTKELLKNPT